MPVRRGGGKDNTKKTSSYRLPAFPAKSGYLLAGDKYRLNYPLPCLALKARQLTV